MVFVPVPNTAQVETIYNLNSSIIENVFYIYGAAEWTAAMLATLNTEVFSWWSTNVKDQQPTGCVLRTIRSRSLEAQIAPVAEYTPTSGNAGVLTGAAVPNNVTCCVTFRTGYSGRTNRGRNYVIGLVQSQLSGDTITSGTVTAWVDAYAALSAAISVNSGNHVVVSRRYQNAWRTTGQTTLVTTYTCDGIIDSQRRRLFGRGQ